MVAEGKERDLLAVLRGKNDVLTLSVMHRFTVREKRKLPKEKKNMSRSRLTNTTAKVPVAVVLNLSNKS